MVSQVGRYRIQKRIGSGGQGEVYRAWDPELLRDVAIKRIAPERSVPRGSGGWIREEARIAASLRHPAIVNVHDILEWEGRTYLVQEFVEGIPFGSE